jgi:hypothetical protein
VITEQMFEHGLVPDARKDTSRVEATATRDHDNISGPASLHASLTNKGTGVATSTPGRRSPARGERATAGSDEGTPQRASIRK